MRVAPKTGNKKNGLLSSHNRVRLMEKKKMLEWQLHTPNSSLTPSFVKEGQRLIHETKWLAFCMLCRHAADREGTARVEIPRQKDSTTT
jgi:hypothetical protein